MWYQSPPEETRDQVSANENVTAIQADPLTTLGEDLEMQAPPVAVSKPGSEYWLP